MSKPKDAPGLLRLRAMGAGPRDGAGRRVVAHIVAPPQITPKRKPKPPAPGQAALF